MGIFDKLKDMMDGDNHDAATGEASASAIPGQVQNSEGSTTLSNGESQPVSSDAEGTVLGTIEAQASVITAEDIAKDAEKTKLRDEIRSEIEAEQKAAADAKAAEEAAAKQTADAAAAEQAAAAQQSAEAQTAAEVPAVTTYTVVEGDTLWDISQAHGTTVEAIVEANSIENPDLIFPGQVLTIPK